MSIDREMGKEDIVHTRNGTKQRNEIVPFAELWVGLETVIQSEVN